jgi:hypothetical protein
MHAKFCCGIHLGIILLAKSTKWDDNIKNDLRGINFEDHGCWNWLRIWPICGNWY